MGGSKTPNKTFISENYSHWNKKWMSLIADQVTGRENYNLEDIFKEIIQNTAQRNKKVIKDKIELNIYIKTFNKSSGKREQRMGKRWYSSDNCYGYSTI